MAFLDWLIIVVIGVNIVLTTVIYFQAPKEKANRYYAMFVIFLTLFIISAFLENKPDIVGLENVEKFLRLDFTFGLLFFYYWFKFCVAFTKNPLGGKSYQWFQWFLRIKIAFLLFLVLATERIITNVAFDGVILFEPGPVWGPYGYSILLYSLGGIALLVKNRIQAAKKKDRILARQLDFIIYGFIISVGSGLFIFLFLQTFFTISVAVSNLGLYIVMFLGVFSAYAMSRYNLFQLKLVAAHVLVPVLATSALLNVFTNVTGTQEVVVDSILFVFITLFGILLIRGFNKEIDARERTEGLLLRLRNFVSFATHELRGPIANFRGAVDMIQKGDFGDVPGDMKSILRDLFIEADGMGLTVDMFLNLNKIDSEGFVLSAKEQDIRPLLQAVVDQSQHQAAQKGVTLTSELPEESIRLSFDFFKLQHVLKNVLENSIKYNNKHGTVHLGFEDSADTFVIRIEDTGVGMDADTLAEVFTKYERGRGKERTSIEGHGIGMWLSKKIVDMHGGAIAAESDGPGKGSVFTISLKRNTAAEEVSAAA